MAGSLKTFLRNRVVAILRLFKPYRSWSLIPRNGVDFAKLTGIKVLSVKEHRAVKRLAPLTTDYQIYRKFKELLHDTPQKTFVIEAHNWRVWGNQGAVISDGEYLFKDVSREFESPAHSALNQFKLVGTRYLKGTSAVISTSGADMYYHWMADVLPRIKLLAECNLIEKIDHFIIDYRDIPFQEEALKILDIDLSKIERSVSHFNYHIVAEHLVVPSLPSKINIVSADACKFLMDTFLNKDMISPYGKKIYLKRNHKRNVLNNNEIEHYLKNIGFESVACENYSVREQAAIFYNADVIIGPHGGAFTNLVFCKPGTKAIEFFSPKWINPCYWTICNETGIAYYYLMGEGDESEIDLNANITVNLNKLKQLIEKFNIN